jgi:segregation and condensation protein B
MAASSPEHDAIEPPEAYRMKSEQLVNTLECLLFVSDEPLEPRRLSDILQVKPEQVAELVEQLGRKLEGHGLHVVHLAGGYSLATRPEHAEAVQQLLQPDPQRLSRQALEVLAIVAYRQPITRPELDALRGVNSSGVVNSLIERDLLRITGRANVPGRPFLLATTNFFLSLFGLKDLSDLPEIDLPLPDSRPEDAPLPEAAALADAKQSEDEEKSPAESAPQKH